MKKAINLKKQIAMGGNPAVSGNGMGPMPMMCHGGSMKGYKHGGRITSGRHPGNKNDDHKISGHSGKQFEHVNGRKK